MSGLCAISIECCEVCVVVKLSIADENRIVILTVMMMMMMMMMTMVVFFLLMLLVVEWVGGGKGFCDQ